MDIFLLVSSVLMQAIAKRICAVLFILGMGIGLSVTEAGYTNYSYPYNANYSSFPVVNSNPYSFNRAVSSDCLMQWYCGNTVYMNRGWYGNYYDQTNSYPRQHQWLTDNTINNSYNTTNNIEIDYKVDNRHYYDYKYNYNYNISNSYNQTTTQQAPIVRPQPIVKPQTVVTKPVYQIPQHVTPTPTYQCKSGESMVWWKNQCLSGQWSVCYQRPDGKRCTKKGTVAPPTFNCPSTYQPVCGANSATYSNSCVAQQAWVAITCQWTCPCNKPTPTPPTYQCKSGESMVWWKNQCQQWYWSVCYQRPDGKRCTKKWHTPPPENCEEQPEEVCTTQVKSKRGDKYMSTLGLTIPTSLSHIKQYRIQWFNGTRSQWYTPGNNDIDRKTNCEWNSTQTNNCARRVWSYFDDHTYEVKTCTIKYPTTNKCTQTTNYYHQPQQQNNYGWYTSSAYTNSYRNSITPTNNAYAIQRHYGPTASPSSNAASASHNSPSWSSNYGWNTDAHYTANPRTYGFVEDINNTFR